MKTPKYLIILISFIMNGCFLLPNGNINDQSLLALAMLMAGGATTSENADPSLEMSSFSISGQSGIIGADSIGVTLPFGSSLTGQVATFTHTGKAALVGTVQQLSGTTTNNFSSPVVYTIISENGTTKLYTVTVTVADGTAKDIIAFSILGQTGTIGANSIGVTVPFGTNPNNLIPTFTISGASINVSGVNQVSATSSNNFTSPKIYTVVAADGSTKDYTVTVAVAANPAKDITAFSILGQVGTIGTNSIGVTVPYGTNPNSLIATFTISGASINISGVNQVSGATANNFTFAKVYTVVAADGSSKNYTVTVAISDGSIKNITAFSILGQSGTIGANSIGVTLPFGTNPNSLIATFTISGASINIGGANQVSATTANNFTTPKIYTVVAADGSTKDYTVTVAVALNPAKDITAFSILGQAGTIGASSIGVTVPYGTNPNSLVATFTISGASINISGVNQSSATTANDFTSPKVYRVVAADGSTKDYTVTVAVALNPAKDITAFSILGQAGTIGANSIGVTVPYGTNPNSLVATFTISGSSINIAGVNQSSATTANDFTSPKVYRVVAADGSTKDYTVTVAVALNPAKDITAFSILGQAGTIGASSIGVTVPYGTNPNSLVATFTISGASINISGVNQSSATTANDFTSPKVYRVVAADGSTKDYTVTVAVALNPAKVITAFSILGQAGTIGANSIGVTVPFGTNPNSLVATFTISGASVNIAGVNQSSATTANDFTSSKIYTVVAADGSTKDYTVTVTIALNSAKDITAFSILGQAGTIGTNTIAVTLPPATNPNGLVATFTISGASINIGGTNQVSATTTNDFTSPRVYTVVAADGSTKDYTVTVTVLVLTNRAWTSITSSSDGTKLAAVVSNGQIYTSTDSGITWTARDSNRNWRSITSSSDGDKLAAVVFGGQIYTSTDSGFTWTARDIYRNWTSITSSSDGTKLAAVVRPSNIFYTSTNSGLTWTATGSNTTEENWTSITSSSDGTKLAAVARLSEIFNSTDSGFTWTASGIRSDWWSITSSSDGTKLAAVVNGGQIYTSTDSGITWTARESNRRWRSITSSSDGNKLAAVFENGLVYTSTDSGLNWTARESNRNWRSIISSSDGTKLAAVVFGGQIYTSTDSGVTWQVRF